jgi:aspartyl-tRNA(Asn)/glutamyl-tRNA(Gln) amidotransferase subunit A
MSEIARALDERTTTAQALIETAIANHDKHDTKLKAYMQWLPDMARKAAAAADASFAAGVRVGSLQGLPVAVKDNYAMNWLPT